MERDHRHQVDATQDAEQRHEPQPLHHEADKGTFSDSGVIPPVETEDAVRPPQPSASDRAFGTGTKPRATEDRNVLAAAASKNFHGITVIAPAGTHATAIDKCAEFINLEIGRNQFAQQRLAAARTTIVIIPAHTQMTDVPAFSGLRGTQTFDGRAWEGVRGSGGMPQADGSFAIGVAEENLIAVRGVVSDYTKGYSIGMHEFAHALESKGLTPDQQDRLGKLFKHQSKKDRVDPSTHHESFTDNYAASNQHEYFAQATNAFFGKNEGAHRDTPLVGHAIANHNGREWLRLNDPDMYTFLVELYETEHDADGHRVS